MFDSGTLIAGRYVIHSPLASGGNGLVYSATDRTTEKRVAIKILGPHVMHERAAREKLRLEAIIAGRVESENVVQILDAGVDGSSGYPFLVMELLRGSDLQHWVEENGPLDAVTTCEFLRQVASGLDKSHMWKDAEQRTVAIVHRDLKPENLFLTHRDDGTPLVKILDFGLAKVLSTSATMSSEVRGTPLYMAPEQLSQRPVTPATDIWALGLVAFFLLTGKCYWRSGQNVNAILPAVLKEVSDGPPVSPQARLQEFGATQILPQAFDEWFLRCVNLEPSERYQSAGEAVRALGHALDVPQRSSPLGSSAALSVPERLSLADANPASGNNSLPAVEAPVNPGRRRLYWLAVLAALGILVLVFARTRVASTVATATQSAGAAAPSADGRVAMPPPLVEARDNAPQPARSTPSAADTADPPTQAHKPERATPSGSRTRGASSNPRLPSPTSHTTPSGSAAAPNPEAATAPRVHQDPADHR